MSTDHFHGLVPDLVKNKLLALVQMIEDDTDLIVTGNKRHGLQGCRNIDPIYGYHVSGFIPFQQGGFRFSDLVQCDQDCSYHFCEAQTEFVDRQVKDCEKQFLQDHDLPEDLGWSDFTEDQQVKFYDYEHEWLEPALFYVEMFADGYQEGKPHIVFRVGVNYRDAPYFREKYGTDVRTLTLEEGEFLVATFAEILEQLEV